MVAPKSRWPADKVEHRPIAQLIPDARLSVVGDLAERFTARIIGVAAQARPVYYADDLDGARFVEADRGAMLNL
jgi:hypothetical protein